MYTFEETLEKELVFTDEALKYLKDSLSEVDRGHIGPEMKEKILGIVNSLVSPTKLTIDSSHVFHQMSPTKQSELMIWIDGIEKQNLKDLDILLHEESQIAEAKK